MTKTPATSCLYLIQTYNILKWRVFSQLYLALYLGPWPMQRSSRWGPLTPSTPTWRWSLAALQNIPSMTRTVPDKMLQAFLQWTKTLRSDHNVGSEPVYEELGAVSTKIVDLMDLVQWGLHGAGAELGTGHGVRRLLPCPRPWWVGSWSPATGNPGNDVDQTHVTTKRDIHTLGDSTAPVSPAH